MKGRGKIPVILVNTLLVFCALFLIASLVWIGTGIIVFVSIVVSLGALIFFLYFPRIPALVAIRRAPRRFSPRAPPRF